MNITTIGRGNVGGGLARRWEKAGHTVTQLGRDGGDATDADVVLVAVPSDAIADALATVSGLGVRGSSGPRGPGGPWRRHASSRSRAADTSAGWKPGRRPAERRAAPDQQDHDLRLEQ